MKTVFLITLAALCNSLWAGYPESRKMTVTDVFHGIEVTEDYRWLEDADSAQRKEWLKQQNQFSRDYVAELKSTDQIREEVAKIMSAEIVSYAGVGYAGGQYFALKFKPPVQQPYLVTFPNMDQLKEAKVLVDPNTINPDGTTAIDWYHPSPDGKLVAVSLSVGGSEAGDLHVFEVETGKQVFEVVRRVNTGTAGGDLAWVPDSSGFFYTRHPLPGERDEKDINFYQQAYYHELGTDPKEDRYEIGKDFPRIAEIEFEMHLESGQLLLTVQNGDGGEFAHYLRSPEGQWRQFSYFEDKLIQATFRDGNALFALSRENAPRGKIIEISTTELTQKDARIIIPQEEHTIVNSFYHRPPSIVATESLLFVRYQKGGPSEIKTFDHEGKRVDAPEQHPVANVDGIVPLQKDDILFFSISYAEPKSYYQFNAANSKTRKLPLSSSSTVDFSDIEVRREYATSKDGTKVPVNILVPKAAKNGGPCIVYGYGGYGISLTPRFSAKLRVLMDRGFVYAVANIRGGGEFGEEWHQQGMLTRKQNVFDDFAAVCQHMIDKGYTTSEHLAIMGGSNGGLLMGATLVQNPSLVQAVVSYVGIYDMLRVELSPNGSFNIPEFGTVKNPDHFKALYAYSPYHNVKNGTAYPAVFFLTGENDPRVDPMQSLKMTARLQEATSSQKPILLRTNANAGHGLDTPLSEQIEETAAVYSFLVEEVGLN